MLSQSAVCTYVNIMQTVTCLVTGKCCNWLLVPTSQLHTTKVLSQQYDDLLAPYTTVGTMLTHGLTFGCVGLPSGHLSSFLAPNSPSDSIPPSPTAMALHRRGHVIASDASGPNQGGAARDAGPRIFVGKLVRGTTEADVRDYFSKFG